jgi:hypothetical protein
MEAKEPLANEKAITPISMISIQKVFSILVLILTSPYPTVVMVVTVKYTDVRYFSPVFMRIMSPSIQVPSPFGENWAVMIQRQATIWIRMKKEKKNPRSLYIPTPMLRNCSMYFANLLFSLIILKILSNLVNLTSLYILPILAILTISLKLFPYRIKSKGIIAKKSIGNQE